MNPQPAFRIKALETRTSTIEAGIEELADSDKALFAHVQQGFDQAHAYIQEHIETVLTDHTKRLDRVEGKLDQILALLQQRPGE